MSLHGFVCLMVVSLVILGWIPGCVYYCNEYAIYSILHFLVGLIFIEMKSANFGLEWCLNFGCAHSPEARLFALSDLHVYLRLG